MITSGYTIDLYCDARGHVGDPTGASLDAQFANESSRACWRAVRKSGWKVSRKTGDAICPACIRKGPDVAESEGPNTTADPIESSQPASIEEPAPSEDEIRDQRLFHLRERITNAELALEQLHSELEQCERGR